MRTIKQIRKEKDLTQVQISEKIQIPIRTYQRYESRKRVPDVYIGQMIAEALGVKLEEIFPINI